jgi:cytochrome c-type biogenesis protein CcmH/NrfG
MARGTQHRKRRPRPTSSAVAQPAPPPKRAKQKAPSWEEQLFFSRLKRHAKIVFVLLALTFAAGFVFFGVGSGSTGISDALQNFFNSSSSGGSSLSGLQSKVKSHPKDSTAWRSLATKLEQDKKTDRAIVALQHYTALQPKDQGAIEELANLYIQRAAVYYNLYSQILTQSQLVSPSSEFRPSPTSPFGKAFANQDPILAQQATIVSNRQNAALQKLTVYNSQSESGYKKLVKLAPANADYQLRLGQIADNLGDTKTAIPAYNAFLKLAANDPSAPQVRVRLKGLKAQAKAQASKQVKLSTTGAKASTGR